MGLIPKANPNNLKAKPTPGWLMGLVDQTLKIDTMRTSTSTTQIVLGPTLL